MRYDILLITCDIWLIFYDIFTFLAAYAAQWSRTSQTHIHLAKIYTTWHNFTQEDTSGYKWTQVDASRH